MENNKEDKMSESKFEYGRIKALQPVSDRLKNYIIYLLKKNNTMASKLEKIKTLLSSNKEESKEHTHNDPHPKTHI